MTKADTNGLPRRAAVRRVILVLALLVAGACLGCARHAATAQQRSDPAFLQEHGLRYWVSARKDPRPLHIHHLRVDLDNPRIELAAALAADPDGDGPATAALEPPLAMARRTGAIALVNANPWQALPDAAGKRSTNWQPGMPVQVQGLAVSGGQVRSPPAADHCAFWIDQERKVHVGDPPKDAKVREGVAGFAQLLRGDEVLPQPGGPIHPRTALGVDESGRWLTLVVVDGRQPGYSEGMTCEELARYMRDMGCRDAVNLDGGGSSVLILSNRGGTQGVMNDPSTKLFGTSMLRPIPVALVVRDKPQD